MVFGLVASVATDLMFLSVQVRYLLRFTYLSLNLCSVYTLCTLTVSKLQFRQRAARLRTHGFWLGFRWCSALSDLLPPTSCFCLCRFGTCYGPLTCLDLCSLSVFTYVICIMCFVTVSKLQFGQREARLRTHGFWLGFRWCSAFAHPLPPTSCFCLCRFSTCLRSTYLS